MNSVPLGDLADLNPRAPRLDGDEPVSFLGLADLQEDGRTTGDETRPYKEVVKGYTAFRDRDLLLAKITPSFQNGKIGQARISHKYGFGSTEFHVIRPDCDRLDSRYLLRFLRQEQIRVMGELRLVGTGGQRRVPESFLAQLEVPLPPIEEQRRIAAILDQADMIRTKRRQVLAHLDELARSAFYAVFGDPQHWPSRWQMGVIDDLARSVAYGTSGKAGASGDWPVLRMGNITDDGRLDLTDLKYIDLADLDVPKYTVRSGDMLFNRTNSKEKVGKSAVVRTDRPLAFAGYLVRVRFDDAATAEYVSAYLASDHGLAVRRRLAKAAVNQANINATEMRGVLIALPPIELRESFAERLAAIEAQRTVVQRALITGDELFKSLQARAFRGEL